MSGMLKVWSVLLLIAIILGFAITTCTIFDLIPKFDAGLGFFLGSIAGFLAGFPTFLIMRGIAETIDNTEKILKSGTSSKSNPSAGSTSSSTSTNGTINKLSSINSNRSYSPQPQGSWTCPSCGMKNPAYITTCTCGEPKNPRPADSEPEPAPTPAPSPAPAPSPDPQPMPAYNPPPMPSQSASAPKPAPSVAPMGMPSTGDVKAPDKSDWQCPNCKTVNPHYSQTCVCGFPRKYI